MLPYHAGRLRDNFIRGTRYVIVPHLRRTSWIEATTGLPVFLLESA